MQQCLRSELVKNTIYIELKAFGFIPIKNYKRKKFTLNLVRIFYNYSSFLRYIIANVSCYFKRFAVNYEEAQRKKKEIEV